MRRAAIAVVAMLAIPAPGLSQACAAGFITSFSSPCFIGSTQFSLTGYDLFPASSLQLFLTPIHSMTAVGNWAGFRVSFRDASDPGTDQRRGTSLPGAPGGETFESLGAMVNMSMTGGMLSAWRAAALSPELSVSSDVPGNAFAHWGLSISDFHSSPPFWFDGATATSDNGGAPVLTSHTEPMPAFGAAVTTLDLNMNHKVAVSVRDLAHAEASSYGWEFEVLDAEVVPEPVTGVLVLSGLVLLALEVSRGRRSRK